MVESCFGTVNGHGRNTLELIDLWMNEDTVVVSEWGAEGVVTAMFRSGPDTEPSLPRNW